MNITGDNILGYWYGSCFLYFFVGLIFYWNLHKIIDWIKLPLLTFFFFWFFWFLILISIMPLFTYVRYLCVIPCIKSFCSYKRKEVFGQISPVFHLYLAGCTTYSVSVKPNFFDLFPRFSYDSLPQFQSPQKYKMIFINECL